MAEYICGVGETYPNLKSLEGVVDNGDIISLTDTGEIDDSGAVPGLNKSLTLRSHPSNMQRARVRLIDATPSTPSIYIGGTVPKPIENIVFRAATAISIWPVSDFVIDSCELYCDNPSGAPSGIVVFLNTGYNIGDLWVVNCLFHDIPGVVCGGMIYLGDFDFLNNSIYNFCVAESSNKAAVDFIDYAYNIRIMNNIIHGAGNSYACGIDIGAATYVTTLVQDYNTLHSLAVEYLNNAVSASHNRDSTQTPGATDPLFNNPTNRNLKLNINSPCIDAGAGTGVYSGIPTTDFMDSTRPYVWTDKSSVDNGTDMGAYEMNPNYYSMSSFDQSTATAGQLVTSTVDKESLIDKIQAAGTDTYFDATSELSSVVVRYTHEDGRQRKTIVHSGSGLQGQTSWPAGARDGTWEKTEVISYDANGAQKTLLRSDISPDVDIVMTDGTMNLNS